MVICGIYQILNTLTGKCYVGSSIDIENQRWPHHKKRLNGNDHHSIKLQRSWNKHGSCPVIWKWNILQECEEAQLHWLEAFWQAKLNSVDAGYNIRKIGLLGRTQKYFRITTYKASLETRKKNGDAHRGKILSDIHREKIKISLLNHKVTNETRDKISKMNVGKKRTEEQKARLKASKQNISLETRKKIGDARRGKVVSEENRKKQSITMTGKPKSEEHKAKLSKASKFKPKSKEHRKAMSEAGKLVWINRKTKSDA